MKIKIAILAHLALFMLLVLLILFALPGCVGGNTNQKQADTKTVLAREEPYAPEFTEEENNMAGITGNDGGDPFSTVVAGYTPEQIKQLLGKTAPENVRDLFALLPDEAFFELTAQERKQLMEHNKYDPEGDSMTYLVDETATGENYIRLIGTFEGTWEIFAKKKGDTWWIAVSGQFCGPYCLTHIANSYSFKDNRLTLHTDANLAGYQDVWVELFIDFDRLTPQQQEAARKTWDENGLDAVLFKLPTDGNTITMYIDELPYLDENIPSETFRSVEAVMWDF